MSITYLEAAVIGLVQGVSELFPVSSLGHSVLIPALIGGRWSTDLNITADRSPYLTFIVGLHVATAIALILFFRRDWVRIVRGILTSIRDREVVTADQRLGWLLVLGTIPVGLAGVVLEKVVRTELAKPDPTAVFLMLNGLVLIAGEQMRKRQGRAMTGDAHSGGVEADERLSKLSVKRAVLVGGAQIAALFPGISRSGSVLVAGMAPGRGQLDHGDSARFSFLLATPVILLAGLYKLPSLAGSQGDGIRGQVLVGSILSGIAAYAAVAFLTKFFRTNSATPFGIYCLAGGAASLAVLVARG